MKIPENSIGSMRYIIALSLIAIFALTSPAPAKNLPVEKVKFLQTIQNRLARASGLGGVTLSIIASQKHKINLTPSAIRLPYGFLKNIKNVNQLIAALAHLTAYIRLGYATPRPRSDNTSRNRKKTTLGDFLKSAIRPEALDESYIPKDQQTFQKDNSEDFTRPRYQNKTYDYIVNKTSIVTAEHKLKADKATDKIMKRAGFCPGDYSRFLHYLYKNPQKFRGSKYFALDADQWQRIDVADRRADPRTPCNHNQIAQTQQYATAFSQLKSKILLASKSGKSGVRTH